MREADMRPLSEIEAELAKTNPEALKRSREAMDFFDATRKSIIK